MQTEENFCIAHLLRAHYATAISHLFFFSNPSRCAIECSLLFFHSYTNGACSVAASYKLPMLVTRVRLPACAYYPLRDTIHKVGDIIKKKCLSHDGMLLSKSMQIQVQSHKQERHPIFNFQARYLQHTTNANSILAGNSASEHKKNKKKNKGKLNENMYETFALESLKQRGRRRPQYLHDLQGPPSIHLRDNY